jgi:nitronate monooxygenase
VSANFLRDSVKRTGLDPDNLPAADKTKMSFAEGSHEFKAWRDVWSAGQSVSGVREVLPVSALVERMAAEYEAARARLAPQAS